MTATDQLDKCLRACRIEHICDCLDSLGMRLTRDETFHLAALIEPRYYRGSLEVAQ